MPITTTTLLSGSKIPVIGLGTWLSKTGEVGKAVEIAIDNGYTHIDCAQVYANQHEIGPVFQKTINAKKIKRDDLFVTSKIWNTFHSHDRALISINSILKDLQLDYLDLCLIHWPMGFEEGGEMFPKNCDGKMHFSDIDYMETWRAMEEAVKSRKIRSIGLSNFNAQQTKRVFDESEIKPAVLQSSFPVEMHPYLQQKKLLELCQNLGILIVAYSPLGNPANPFRKEGQADIFQDAVILEIAKKHSKSPAQVAIRWAIQRGVVPIPKSVNETRIAENIDVFDFKLTPAEMVEMANLDKNMRIIDLTPRDGHHRYFPHHC